MTSKPGPSFTIGGFRPTGRYRIRIAWFCFPVVEELYEYSDGAWRWQRMPWLSTVEFSRSQPPLTVSDLSADEIAALGEEWKRTYGVVGKRKRL